VNMYSLDIISTNVCFGTPTHLVTPLPLVGMR
jgi:hypothetical protein